MSWAMECDFLCIGAGIGGLSGAIAATDAGLGALVLEKSELVGGVAALSLGQLWVAANHLQLAAGIADTPEEGFRYMQWVGGGRSDPVLARVLCEQAPAVIRYFAEAAGVKWRLFAPYPDYFWPMADGSAEQGRYLETEPFPATSLGAWQARTRKGASSSLTNAESRDPPAGLAAERAARDQRTMGGGLGGYLTKAALDRQIPLVTGFKVRRLLREGERVVGVEGELGGRTIKVAARRGVLVATSGYDWDRGLVSRFDARQGVSSRTQPAVTGDHLRWSGMIGAQIASVTARPQWVGLSFRCPDVCDDEGVPLWQGVSFRYPGIVLVNRHGRRFCDESWGPSYVAALSHADLERPGLANQPFWAVFDDAHRTRYRVGLSAPGTPLPSVVKSAPDLRSLANLMGIDPEGLEAQVQRFNGFAATGADPDFGRGTRPQGRANGDPAAPHPNLGPVDCPPFHAVQLEACSIGIPTAGLVADEHARVLDWEDRPVPGLYVTGNSMAMIDLGLGYNSGMGNTRGMVFGYLAAQHASRAEGVDKVT